MQINSIIQIYPHVLAKNHAPNPPESELCLYYVIYIWRVNRGKDEGLPDLEETAIH